MKINVGRNAKPTLEGRTGENGAGFAKKDIVGRENSREADQAEKLVGEDGRTPWETSRGMTRHPAGGG